MNLNFDLYLYYDFQKVSGVRTEAPWNAVDLKKDRASRFINFSSLQILAHF